jgi:hypothetical protein
VNYLADHLAKHLCGNGKAVIGYEVGKVREVLTLKSKHREGSFTARDLTVKLVVDVDGDIVIGKNSDGLIKTLGVNDKASGSFNLDRINDGSEALVHIVGGNLYLSVVESFDEHTLDRSDRVLV